MKASARVLALPALAACLAGGALAACSKDEAGPGTDPTVCTSAGRWPRETTFAIEDEETSNLTACAGHCGPNEESTTKPGLVTSDALPYGACMGTTACTMPAERLGVCPPGTVASGPLNHFVCRCESGTWVCRIDARAPASGSTACSAPDAGAGADGG